MIRIPVLRWGEPYESLETDRIVHFQTGELLAEIDRANAAMVERDLRHAARARHLLRQIPVAELLQMVQRAADLYLSAELPLGNGTQTPQQFVRLQSATTGLPEHMCRFNMEKNHFVLSNMRQILEALTRGLDLTILGRGYGVESRGVPLSYQCQSPVLGLVLPSNSPGVHTLWLPVIPLQVGLVMKPGSQEPWTPFRMFAALTAAGVPKQAIAIYPGSTDVGAAILNNCQRSLIFGSATTVEQYRSNPRVQVHGPGFSKILFGDDKVDEWERYIDVMVDSIYVNGGRSCINCSAIWASRHTEKIAEALAARLGPVQPLPPDDPRAGLAAFTVPGQAEGVDADIEAALKEPGVTDVTGPKYGPRLVKMERCAYLRPTIIHCENPDAAIANKEYMFPFCVVVKCPQEKMLDKIGPTLVCTAITANPQFQRALLDAPHIDRLNIGPIPTVKLNWLQPHEGNIVDFLFRSRAFQYDGDWIRV